MNCSDTLGDTILIVCVASPKVYQYTLSKLKIYTSI